MALRQWGRSADVAAISDNVVLDDAAADERAARERFWADVAALLKKVREAGKPAP
jgi:hypothetical protein